jgi:alpha-L-rhamnosidase
VHTLYRAYGDTRIVERNFAALARYLAWLGGGRKEGGLTLRTLGDHLNLGGGANLDVIQRAYFAHLSSLMAEMAAAIGRPDDAARYRAQSDEAKTAFQRDFILPDGSIKESSQTGYALAFTMDLVPAELRTKVAEKFVEEIQQRDWHLATGFIGTPRLLPGLHLAGRDDVAYRLLLQDTFPSWLFPVKNGATTVWERWDGWTPDRGFQTISMNSFNHYAFGSVAEYLYRQVAGIDSDGPGYRKIVIRPAIAAGLTSARAAYASVAGRIESAWRIENGRLHLDVTVPPNTTATVFVPAVAPDQVTEGGKPAAGARGVSRLGAEGGAAVFRVGSGQYRFESQLP